MEARHGHTSLAYKASEMHHSINLQGCKHGEEADLRMSRLRRREAGSLAKRPFRMEATSIMRLSLRRSSLGFARKRYTLPSLPIRSTCRATLLI